MDWALPGECQGGDTHNYIDETGDNIMLSVKEGLHIASQRAWSDMGARHPKLFIALPLMSRMLKVLVPCVGFALGALFVYQHVGTWSLWVGVHLLPSLLIASSVALYGVAAVIVWRVFSWRWVLSGLTARGYTLGCVWLLLMVAGTSGLMIGV